ncbi:cytochrome b/b6 domain-containing protein [Croceicoccus sp. Ery15]|uniref:cytochrome b/b6 domain-containing protein n=1 Tax=Croceicoccus sp. Ery15 TaxID=1703338 RepID=UPI001E5A34EB|nr:cytochrome b/b6 domain-containing protein [Croceicoccus sp. Ery15]
MTEATAAAPVKLWDLPVRICHWSFVLLIPAMWWTAENNEMGWHMRLGLILLVLLTFRVLWGFFGSSTARFVSFLRGPGAVLAYFRSLGGGHAPIIGHNPAGGWSVMALLGAMLLQLGMGLFAGDPYDGATGPLNGLVGVMTADSLTEWHEGFFWVLVALIALHVMAVLLYLTVKRDNLVRPMVTGSRPAPAGTVGMAPASAWRALLCLAIAVGFAGWIWNGAPPF